LCSTLKNADNYSILVNAVVDCTTISSREELEQQFRSNQLYTIYDLPKKNILLQEIFGVIFEFINTNDGKAGEQKRAKAIAESFRPWREGCTPSEWWDWDERFNRFLGCKKAFEIGRVTINDPDYQGYNWTDAKMHWHLQREYKEEYTLQRELPEFLIKAVSESHEANKASILEKEERRRKCKPPPAPVLKPVPSPCTVPPPLISEARKEKAHSRGFLDGQQQASKFQTGCYLEGVWVKDEELEDPFDQVLRKNELGQGQVAYEYNGTTYYQPALGRTYEQGQVAYEYNGTTYYQSALGRTYEQGQGAYKHKGTTYYQPALGRTYEMYSCNPVGYVLKVEGTYLSLICPRSRQRS